MMGGEYDQISRKMSPTLEEMEHLPTPLNEGELKLLNFFIEHLDPKWEIYTQPPLNGVSPDFVLLHPENGIAVFEVKDWAPDTNNEILVKHKRYNLIQKIQLYRDKLQEALGPSAPNSLFPNLTAGLVFPQWGSEKIKAIFDDDFRTLHKFRSDKFLTKSGNEAQFKNNLIIGQKNLESGSIKNVFPNFNVRHSLMDEELLKLIRPWLNSSEFDFEQSTPFNPDPEQYKFISNRNKTKMRRLRGSAGSGKTIVAAGRAAELAFEDKKILLCNYNITLRNYLRDCTMRYARNNISETPKLNYISDKITFLHFHSWVREIFKIYGTSSENLIRKKDALLDDKILPLLKNIIERNMPLKDKDLLYYDAIIVDEGQDFLPEWWSVLRSVLAPNGEMLLVADPTQDVYETAHKWTNVSMKGAGFSGEWAELKKNYRMPDELTELTNLFAQTFLPNTGNENSENQLSEVPDQQSSKTKDIPEVEVKWIMIQPGDNPIQIFTHEISALIERAEMLSTDLSIADIVFLVGEKKIGHEVSKVLREKYRIEVLSTFDDDPVKNRSEKIAFYKGVPKLKGVTIKSFKGLESKAIVLYIDENNTEKNYREIYTALTRLKKSEKNNDLSFITVVCRDQKFANYAKNWRGRRIYRRLPEFNPIQINLDQTNVDYQLLFEDILIDASAVTLNDPYIRVRHQFKNLKNLLNVYKQANLFQEGLSFFLKTGSETKNRHLTVEQQQQKELNQQRELNNLIDYAKKINIHLEWTIDNNFHDRLLTTNHGWSVDLPKGIDIFKRPEPGLDENDYLKRKCVETKLTYYYRKLAMNEYEKL